MRTQKRKKFIKETDEHMRINHVQFNKPATSKDEYEK
jgi:hypothetical protein